MLNKDSIKTLVASSLYSFYDNILKDEFATKKHIDDKVVGLATEEYVQNAIKSAGTGSSDVATDDEVKTAINAILGGDYIE